MHPNAAFRTDDESLLLARLAARPLATLSVALDGRMVVAHAPVVARRLPGGLALDFHVSRANALAPALAGGFRAVAVSLEAEAYISPDWYADADQVPTWNYLSVEAEGPVAALDDAGLVALLDDLSAQEEAKLLPKKPWTRHKMSPGRFETMTRAIIGARMTIERLEGITKLSQNKSDADVAGVVAALGDHPIGRAMAR
ncbi:MAG: FMN-binding negative transcriptional regulator [Phenylobacterium sp.]